MGYSLGKLPAREDAVKLRFAAYKIALPKYPESFGYDNLVTDWQMLANNEVGDCVWAGAAHETMLWNKEAKKTVTFSNQSVLSDYSAVTGYNGSPDTDNGTDVAVAAQYRQKTGVLDANGQRHKVYAYLGLQPRNIDELKQALYLFSAVGIGWALPESAMQQTDDNKPWTVVVGSPIAGGHYTPAVGYDKDYLYIVTWGQIQKVAWDFVTTYQDEGIAYLDTEMLTNNKSLENFSLDQLEKDLKAL